VDADAVIAPAPIFVERPIAGVLIVGDLAARSAEQVTAGDGHQHVTGTRRNSQLIGRSVRKRTRHRTDRDLLRNRDH